MFGFVSIRPECIPEIHKSENFCTPDILFLILLALVGVCLIKIKSKNKIKQMKFYSFLFCQLSVSTTDR